MSGHGLLDLYRNAECEAFRLEARQEYWVPAESAQWQAFREGKPLPRDPAVEESMAIIREAVARGVLVHRVHVIDLPLTPYLRYELAAYAENVAAGEDVSIAVRSWHPALHLLTGDFALFDPGTPQQATVRIGYGEDGRLRGSSHITDPGDITVAAALRDTALEHAVPLRDFTALAEAG